MAHRIAFIGFGGVGQGLAEIIRNQGKELVEKEGLDLQVVAISDMMKGSLYHPEGLNLNVVNETLKSTGSLQSYPERTRVSLEDLIVCKRSSNQMRIRLSKSRLRM